MLWTLFYIYLGAGLMFSSVLFLINEETNGVVYDILWITLITLLWPVFVWAIIMSRP